MHMLYFTMKRSNLILMASCSCTIQQQNDPAAACARTA
jgi:hypothetical protein